MEKNDVFIKYMQAILWYFQDLNEETLAFETIDTETTQGFITIVAQIQKLSMLKDLINLFWHL